jgi:AraC-like DNA-binding protein
MTDCALRTALGEPFADDACSCLRVARWRHSGAEVSFADDGLTTLLMSLSAGQLVTCSDRSGSVTARATKGSITIPGHDGRNYRIVGDADIISIRIRRISGQVRPTFMAESPTLSGVGVRALEIVRHGGDELLAEELYADLNRILAPPHRPAVSQGGLSTAQLRRVMEFIEGEADAGRSPRLADLADLANVSLFHFAHEFRTSTGKSPYAYSLQQRVERSRKMLLRSDQAIAEIAGRCGFSSAAHFARRFRQAVGVAPSRYRELLLD